MGTALIDREWRVVGLSSGWRRRTGILRAELLAAPLLCYAHPEDVPALMRLGSLIDHAPGAVRVRVGTWGQWTEVRLRAGRRFGDLSLVEVEAPELPRSHWWRPTDVELPREPQPMAIA